MILETRALTRRFGSFLAVDRLDLDVAERDIFGFLGPNGAGKTTTIRMLLRLIPRSSGEVRIFGKDLDRSALEILAKVGAVVEAPAFYPYLSGRNNLRVFGRLQGGVSRARIDEVLELVGLEDRAGDKVRVYSQGMRQRLGIAQALLGKPKLLFLDEPTNGLDPPGIEEMRRLLGRLARDEGVTIFMSSHLLHEVELVCNRLAILERGRLLVQGEVSSLLETGTLRVEVEVEGAPEAASEVAASLGLRTVAVDGTAGRLTVACAREMTPRLCAALVGRGIGVRSLVPRRPTLEEYFRERLGGGRGNGAGSGESERGAGGVASERAGASAPRGGTVER